MTSYGTEIKKCPNCNIQFQITILLSCNTIGAKFYTDGFVDGRMYDAGSALVNCPKCCKYLWPEDLPTIEFLRDDYELSDNLEYQPFLYTRTLSGRDYESAMRREIWKNKTQEKYIRIRAWWSSNHIYRPQPGFAVKSEVIVRETIREIMGDPEKLDADPMRREVWERKKLTEDPENLRLERIANLQRLLVLFDAEGVDAIIERAEILRELGHFDECLKLINESFRDDYPSVMKVIKRLAEEGKDQVALIE